MMRFGWLALFVSSIALAQTPRELFDEGTALYAKGEYAKAAQKFEASFAARPVPVTKFNIARAWEQAGQTLKAIDAWQAWLAMSPKAAERPEAERSLEALGEKLAKLGVQALTITSLPAGASVSIDGTKAGVTPVTVELPPTQHLVRLDADGRVPLERKVTTTLEHPAVEAFELVALGEQPTAIAPTRRTALPAPLPSPTQPRATNPEFAFSMADDTVQVHIETTDEDVRLQRLNGNPNGECRAPCDAPVNRASDRFYVTGTGIVSSGQFVLADHAHRKRVVLNVKGGSSLPLTLGILFGTAAIGGLSVAFAFGIGSSSDKGLPVGLGLAIGIGGLIGAVASFLSSGTAVTFPED